MSVKLNIQVTIIKHTNLITYIFSCLECPDGWEYYNQSCYQLFSEKYGLTWLRGEKLCTEFDGHLVSLQSRRELDFIHSFYIEKWTKNITDGGDFYIGMCLTFSHIQTRFEAFADDELCKH